MSDLWQDLWERCVICGAEWAVGARSECPWYRDAAHRCRRANVRDQDVFRYDRLAPAPDDPAAPVPPSHLDCAKLVIAIVTHDRPQALEQTLRSALASVPTWSRVYLFGNHPNDAAICARLAATAPRVEFVPTSRTPEDHGNLSKSWNTALQWAFRDPEVEWFWGMHDDVLIHAGWPQLVAAHPADFYAAPFGDMAFLLSRRAFRAVGWFDERYVTRHFQDSDYLMRATWKLGPQRVVLENSGVNLRWVVLNSIGLSRYWTPTQPFDNSPTRQKLQPFGWEWFTTKWANAFGAPPRGEVHWETAVAQGPVVADLDWYPWFAR